MATFINLRRGRKFKAGNRPPCPRCKEPMIYMSRHGDHFIDIQWFCVDCGWAKVISRRSKAEASRPSQH